MHPDPENGAPAHEAANHARTFEYEGVVWICHVEGVGVAGTGRFAFSGLQLMRFGRAGAGEPEREIVTALRDPDDLHDSELIGLLLDSRPIEARPFDLRPEETGEGEPDSPPVVDGHEPGDWR
jgi:hypothetical protein